MGVKGPLAPCGVKGHGSTYTELIYVGSEGKGEFAKNHVIALSRLDHEFGSFTIYQIYQ